MLAAEQLRRASVLGSLGGTISGWPNAFRSDAKLPLSSTGRSSFEPLTARLALCAARVTNMDPLSLPTFFIWTQQFNISDHSIVFGFIVFGFNANRLVGQTRRFPPVISWNARTTRHRSFAPMNRALVRALGDTPSGHPPLLDSIPAWHSVHHRVEVALEGAFCR